MLKFSPQQFSALADATEHRFVTEVRHFLESDYPEAAGLDEGEGQANARKLINQAAHFGLTSRGAVMRYISMLLDYFIHDPEAYSWAHELLSARDVSEEH